jgi:hypothetical protein
MTMHRGSCHCGGIAFEVEGEIGAVLECNCSICTKKAYLHWVVPRDAFHLQTAEDAISTYTFNTGIAQHHFCRVCGVAPFYIPRSHPDQIDVNLRCVEGVDLANLPIHRFDGQNWDESIQALLEKS